MQNLKISHLVCAFPPYRSGIGNACLSQAKMGNFFNHKITVITPKYKNLNSEHDEKIDNIDIKRIKPLFEFGNAGYINTYKYIKNSDIIHIHYPFYGSVELSIFFAKIKHKKIIIFWHMIPESPGIKGLIFRLYENLIAPIIFKNADKILVSTYDYFENYSPKLFNKFKSKIIEFPFGINLNDFKIQEKDTEIVNKHNLENKNMLLFVGGLDTPHYFKGLEILMKSIKELGDKYCTFIIGDGDLKSYYINLAKELNIENKVIFIGNASNHELRKYYNTCDCFIFPSLTKSEAFGIVQIEAMASSKPVIASNLPGVKTVMKNNETGLLFETGNYIDLKEKIEKLFDNKLAEKYGQNARIRVENYYNEEKLAEKLNSIYENMLN